MDYFLYKIKLSEINTSTNKKYLLQTMTKHSKVQTTIGHYIHYLTNRKHNTVVIIGHELFTKLQRIESVLHYALFMAAKNRYLQLYYPIESLPLYASNTVAQIDVEATIKHIKD